MENITKKVSYVISTPDFVSKEPPLIKKAILYEIPIISQGFIDEALHKFALPLHEKYLLVKKDKTVKTSEEVAFVPPKPSSLIARVKRPKKNMVDSLSEIKVIDSRF